VDEKGRFYLGIRKSETEFGEVPAEPTERTEAKREMV
jgi:hypothetical protein